MTPSEVFDRLHAVKGRGYKRRLKVAHEVIAELLEEVAFLESALASKAKPVPIEEDDE